MDKSSRNTIIAAVAIFIVVIIGGIIVFTLFRYSNENNNNIYVDVVENTDKTEDSNEIIDSSSSNTRTSNGQKDADEQHNETIKLDPSKVEITEHDELIQILEGASNSGYIPVNEPRYEDIVDTRPNEYVDDSEDNEEGHTQFDIIQNSIPKLETENDQISDRTREYLIKLSNYTTVNIINSGLVNVSRYCLGEKDQLGNEINIDIILDRLKISIEYKLGYDLYFATATESVFEELCTSWYDLSTEIDKTYKEIMDNKDSLGNGCRVDIQNVLDKNEKFRNIVSKIVDLS